MAKSSYWISDVEGAYALVEGADQRDWWTKVNGWSIADEPGPTDQVHVVNDDPAIGPGRLPFGSLEGWAGRGFHAGPPPGEGAPVAVAVEPVTPQKTPAAAGGAKDKE